MLLPLLLGCTAQLIDTFTAAMPADDLSALRFDIAAGDAVFIADPGAEEITVDVELGGVVGPGQQACEILDAFDFALTATGETAWLSAGFVGVDHMGAWADLVVTGPPRLLLTGADTSGDAEFSGFSGLDFIDGPGDTRVFSIAGDVTILDSSGDLLIEGVGGDLLIEDGSGDIEASDVAGDVHIDDASGDIHITGVGGEVVISDGSGDIQVVDAGGVSIVEDGSGDVHAN